MERGIPGVHSDPDIMGGMPVFIGTRVLVRTMLEYLEHDRSLAEFLDDFPTVRREQALALLRKLEDSLVTAQI